LQNIPYVSTRGHFYRTKTGLVKHADNKIETDYDLSDDLKKIVESYETQNQNLMSEMVIFVHGIWVSKENAKRKNLIFKKSLEYNNYFHPVVGFTWDSKIFGLDYDDLIDISKKNGIKIAKFIADYLTKAQQLKIRLVGHSLGANIILNALPYFQSFVNSDTNIRSVDLLGGAVENNLILKDYGFGDYIENKVDIFFNFFSTNDSVLLTSKKLGKLENPIGLVGAINLTKNIPINFHEKDVTAELTDCSNINKKTKQNRSDHGIYCGVVDEFANLINDGVVPIMVDNWRKQESSNTN
jgi:hypothetical protein